MPDYWSSSFALLTNVVELASMEKIPYPPPPEFGCYSDDDVAKNTNTYQAYTAQDAYSAQQVVQEPVIVAQEPAQEAVVTQEPVQEPAQVASIFDDSLDTSYEPHDDEPLEYTAQEGAQGSDEWDGTVLSTAFMQKETPQVYRMHNAITGQDIIVDMGVLMGRKPSQDIPEGAKSVRLIDPTRTVSRNHAAISFDQDHSLWIEDYGSLNGTFIIDDTGEHKVNKGTPVQLQPPVKIRIGDQIFDFEQEQ